MSGADDARVAPPAWSMAPLTRDVVERSLPRLLEIDADTIGERWTAEHWLLDVPGKWELSRVALDPAGTPVAYVIASRRGGRVHMHRMAAAREARSRGIGTAFVTDLARVALAQGYEEIELKIHATNAGSLRLFDRLRFRVIGHSGDNVVLLGRTADVAARPAAPRDAPSDDSTAHDASAGPGGPR